MQFVDGQKMQTAIANKKKKHEMEMPWSYVGQADGELYCISKRKNCYVAFVELSWDPLVDKGLFIDNFEVCKSYRKSGAGRKAFEEILELGKEMRVDSIGLMANDKESKAFWEKMGFKCDYDNSDGIAMTYYLK